MMPDPDEDADAVNSDPDAVDDDDEATEWDLMLDWPLDGDEDEDEEC